MAILENQLHFEFSISSIDINKLLRFGVFVVAGNASATLVSKVDLFMIGALMNQKMSLIIQSPFLLEV